MRRVKLGELVLESEGVRFEVFWLGDGGVVGDEDAEEGGVASAGRGEKGAGGGKVGAAVA